MLGGFITVLIACIFPIVSYSQEQPKNNIEYFSYELIFPKNQQNRKLGYYDLLVKKGEKQTVQLKLNNKSDKPMKIAVDLNSTKTNSNGIIEYGSNELKNDKSLDYDFPTIVKAPEEVLLEPKSSKVIDLVINVPKKYFEGYIAGGIRLQPVNTEEEPSDEETMVKNEFAYIIGMLLSESNVEKVAPELELNEVYYKLENAEDNLFIDVSNTKAIFIEDLETVITVKDEKTNNKVFETEKSNMKMAPNTKMLLRIPLKFPLYDKKMDAGDYLVDVQFKEKSGLKWSWSKKINVKNHNDKHKDSLESDNTDSSKISIMFIALIALFIAIGAVLAGYFYKKSRKPKKNDKRKNKIKRSITEKER
ncbi:WxL protein peptidoglycan domain-containing protein [Enterococcus termitis]